MATARATSQATARQRPRKGAGGAPPKRRLRVMFLGAGASKAAGLPLTEELLKRIWPRAHEAHGDVWARRRRSADWNTDLKKAVTIIYPDGAYEGYRPLVSDFFTLVEVIDRVHSGRERLPLDARGLLTDLRAEIAEGLTCSVDALRRTSAQIPHHEWLTDANRPDVIVTSNWDTLVEQTALRAGLNVMLRWPRHDQRRTEVLPKDTVVVLKLHGSIDWGTPQDRRFVERSRDWDYERLDRVITPGRPARSSSLDQEPLPTGDDPAKVLLRYRSYDHPNARDRTRVGFAEPLMATMAAGKETFIADLSDLWDDAYWVLSRATRLDVVGYSFPPDDLELRTLLRVSTRQAGLAALNDKLALFICNPSPDTHDRARSYLGMGVHSSFEGAAAWRVGTTADARRRSRRTTRPSTASTGD